MAATLTHIKSKSLLPPDPTQEQEDAALEEEIDPRQELIRRLLEYQKYKNAAEQLGGRPIEGRTVFPRGVLIDKDDPSERPFGDHSVWKLIEAFGKILEKAGSKAVTHNVVVDRMSIGERIGQLADRLRAGGGSFRFDACFDLTLPELELRHQVVVTLLAILELARLKAVRVLQSPTDDTLFITQVSEAAVETARHATITSAVEAGAEEAAADDDAGDQDDVASAPVEAAGGESVEAAGGEAVEAAGGESVEAAGGESVEASAPDPVPEAVTQPVAEPAPEPEQPVEPMQQVQPVQPVQPVEEAKDEDKHEEA
jgi:segregation and condensation protein A